jgi:5-methylcytosine-specific restriction endonuclease McrA
MLRQQKQYYAKNKEEILSKMKVYAEAHPEVNKRAARKYRQSEKGKALTNAKTRNYRARKRGAVGSHTAKEFLEKVKEQKNKCFWCGELFVGTPEADHYIPLIKGGTNFISNIVASCRACNASKSELLPEEFVSYLISSSKVVNPILLEKVRTGQPI